MREPVQYQCFKVSVENRIAHVVLNRPATRNSMIPAFWDELPAIIQALDREALARVIVLSSTGPHFTSGLDTSVFGSTIDNSDNSDNGDNSDDPITMELLNRQRSAKLYDTITYMQQTFTCLEECRVPVLVAIQGGAIGGGVDLVTACDMRFMTGDAFLTIFEINIGMTADVGTFPRITKLLPEGIVKELAYTGRRMLAPEAQALGFVNAVFPDQAAMLDGVMRLAEEIASKAPLAIYGSKRIINYSRDHSTADTLDYISAWSGGMLQSAEINEAIAAATEKRPPEFADLPVKRMQMSKDGIA